MKLATKNKIFDKLHHAFVYGCIGLTFVTAVAITQLGYDYFVNVKPVKKVEKLKAERELLKEGSAFIPDV